MIPQSIVGMLVQLFLGYAAVLDPPSLVSGASGLPLGVAGVELRSASSELKAWAWASILKGRGMCRM